MNVLFVYSLFNIASPAKPLESPELIQFGVSYISSLLKKNNHDTQLLVLSRISGKINEDIIDERVRTFRPKMICFTAVSTEYTFMCVMAKYIRKHYPNLFLVIGGAHVSLNPEGVLDNFDAFCIGEGEFPMLELVTQLEKGITPSAIANLWIKHNDKIEKNPPRPFMQNIDDLPFPDRKMWQEWIIVGVAARHAILLGRGCPFNCSYCSNHALGKLATGTYTRYRSPGNILEEIKELANKFPEQREIYLEVETIGQNKKWALELCSKLEAFNKTRAEPLSFGANLRVTPNLDLRSIFGAFKKANFRFVNIGLESGSERVRREILRRNYSNEDIIRAVKLAREHGLDVTFLNMVGFPGETLADFQETIRMNQLCLPDEGGVSIFYPYPGTDLHALCKEKGLLKKALDTDRERDQAVLDLPGFDKRQIRNAHFWFDYNVYKGHRPLISLWRKLLVQYLVNLKIKYKPLLFYLNYGLKRHVRLAKD